MDFLKLLEASFLYVMNQNMFWGSMGFTTAIAMFVGVMMFDGNMEQTKKGTVAVLSYAGMILWTTTVRILPNAIDRGFIYNDGRPFAGIATIIYLTLAWLLGIVIGVNIFRVRHKIKDDKNAHL